VREVGRGRDELENSLEKSQVLRGVEGGNEDRRPVCMYFAKRILKVSLVYLLAGNKRDYNGLQLGNVSRHTRH